MGLWTTRDAVRVAVIAAAAAALAAAAYVRRVQKDGETTDALDFETTPEKKLVAARKKRLEAVRRQRRERLEAEGVADENTQPCTIKRLFVYPVKSLRGVEVNEAIVEARGFRHDRRWMVVDESGTFLSQRRIPRMALVSARVASEDKDGKPTMLELDCDEMPCSLRVPVVENRRLCQVRVWSDHIANAHDQGENAARWLRRALRTRGEARLVYMGSGCVRPVDPDYAVSSSDETSFADGFPFLAISQASLNDLNKRMGSHLDFDRFRPNIVLGGGEPYQEDRIKEISVSETGLRFRFVKPCSRCKMTTIDQETAESPPSLNVDPLRTLAAFRKKGDDVFLGENLLVTSNEGLGQVLKVGHSYKIESHKRSFLDESEEVKADAKQESNDVKQENIDVKQESNSKQVMHA
ncbi:Molybdenum cofactor sulfurase [Hondaea fermentalgiana]|uniref:Molybdenum cofactor sulfurase n=1 Tax=Hondaea fermentalgiana TaxID=2315210 RepID=A0A2R5G447_9STRA|nr:Molybdenum cofactor sulfurase [Hondaea fermentalgiana]|eukprot:GBG25807.1 Molybdenum cofactor sulfurase [Hondaea fermentalgiana]